MTGRRPGRPGVLGAGAGRLVDEEGAEAAGPSAPLVLLARHSRPEIYARADRLAAVVAANGSRVCHLANLLRAHRPAPIPYLYGVDLDGLRPGGWAEVVVGPAGGYVAARPEAGGVDADLR